MIWKEIKMPELFQVIRDTHMLLHSSIKNPLPSLKSLSDRKYYDFSFHYLKTHRLIFSVWFQIAKKFVQKMKRVQ